MLFRVNTKMCKNPKYYKELRKRKKLDQVISRGDATAAGRRAPGPGLKQQASREGASLDINPPGNSRGQAQFHTPTLLKHKPQANLNQNLVQVLKHQATSVKPRSTSSEFQATSNKLSDPCTTVQEY